MSEKESSLIVKDIKVDLMVPNPDNVNEMDDETLQRLCDEIRDVGFIDPVNLVPMSDGRYFILGGEHRWKAARTIGMEYIPSIIHTDQRWSDRDTFDLVAFRLNVIKGSQNPEKFMKVYERLSSKFGHDKLQDVFAVTDKSLWKKLTKSIKQNLSDSGVPSEVIAQVAEAEKKAKDFNQFTKLVNRVFEKQTESSTGVVVFSSNGSDHIVVQADGKLMDLLKLLEARSKIESRKVSDYLVDALNSVLGGGSATSM